MKVVYLLKSSEPGYKYDVITDKKIIHFGRSERLTGLEWNIKREEILKSVGDIGIDSIHTSKFWDRWIPVGGSPSISESIRRLEKKFPTLKIVKSRMRSPPRRKK